MTRKKLEIAAGALGKQLSEIKRETSCCLSFAVRLAGVHETIALQSVMRLYVALG
jgi:hypothetical protein